MTAPSTANAGSVDLPSAVVAADAAHGLLPDGAAIVVAVSGGPDSVALLDVLVGLAPARGWRLHVAHLDHGLRAAAVDEAARVAALAEGLGVPATLGARDVARLAADEGRSREDAARAARYAFLAAVAARQGAGVVATGHHADDQAETVLMNVVRGAGLDGLRGMRPRAPWPLSAAEVARREPEAAALLAEGGLPTLVRPLLAAWRVDIAAHVARRGLATAHDESNDDPAFLRNRVRREIMPRLEALNPRLREALVRNAAAVAGDVAFIEAAVEAVWTSAASVAPDGRVHVAREAWEASAPAIQRRLVRRAFEALGGDARSLGLDQVDAVRAAFAADRAAAAPVLPGALRVRLEGDALVVGPERVAIPPPRLGPTPVPLAVPGATALPGGWAIEAAVRDRRPGDRLVPPGEWSAALDADALRGALAVRGRAAGDRIQPLGMDGRHRALQDVLVDLKVPAAERDGWPLAVDDAGGRIVWVPGYRIDERVRIGARTRRIVALTARPPARLR